MDSAGVSWRVWTTRPANPRTVVEELRDGWLTFDSAEDRRRIAPIPKGWESFTDERLELACRAALSVRKSDPSGVPVVGAENERDDS